MDHVSPRFAGRSPTPAVAALALAALAVGACPVAAATGPPTPNTILSGTRSSGLAEVLAPAPAGW